MQKFNPTEVLYFKTYYCYDEELYALQFPLVWAKNHFSGTGPKQCVQCSNVGMWNGVFIGYCSSCAHTYNGERGIGFISHGNEQSMDKCENSFSAFSTYLENIKMDDIGDKDLFLDTAEMIRGPTPRMVFDYYNENINVTVCEDTEDDEDELKRQYNEYLKEEEEDDRYYNPAEYYCDRRGIGQNR